MKSTLSVVFLLLLASNLHAQMRHRPTLPPDSTVSGATSVDLGDPYALMFARPELNPPPAPSHPGNVVPVSQLRIPSKAVNEFDRAEKAFRSGDMRNSADHLQKALQIYPDFIQAHNTLGFRLIQLGDYQRALAEYETALSLDPRRAETHQGLSFALLLLNRTKEAEAEARQALDLDSHLVASRYLLGRALIAQRRVTSESMEMLRQSQDAFPDASLVLAQVHFSLGHTDQVIAELRHYLRAPSDLDNKQKAECWVAQLSQQTVPAGCPAETTPPSFR